MERDVDYRMCFRSHAKITSVNRGSCTRRNFVLFKNINMEHLFAYENNPGYREIFNI
jgi:hypothetical protein